MNWISNIIRRSENASPSHGTGEHGPVLANYKRSGATVASDNPIRHSEDDTLGRAAIARSFAQHVLALDTREGVVVGVLGAWGSGKTSFINLARNEFDRANVPILAFNPWMFSGAEQLVESFFTELAAQLKIQLGFTEIAKNIEEYGEAFSGLTWLPVVGSWIEAGRGASKLLSKYLQRHKEGVSGRRTRLESALDKLDRPIVVVLDDIDRLSSSEIRDVFKLVRLTASFPNIIYIVAFDRARVEDALSDQGIPGRDYLEKILQVAIDLPAVPSQIMYRQILTAINDALSGIDNPGPFDDHGWSDLFMEIVRPLVRNMRDVRRYAVAIQGTVNALNGQIALTDVLALEAIRTFLPDVYARFHSTVEGLTVTSDTSYGSRSNLPYLKASVDALIEASGTHQEVIKSMIRRLFPAAERHIGGSNYGGDWRGRWLRERRVAHDEILRLYLERVAGEGLQAFTDAERAFGVMADQTAFDSYLRSLDVERLEDVIASLEAFEDRFSAEHVVPGTIVLLNLLPELPELHRGLLGFSARFTVTRVTYRLLRSLSDPNDIEAAVRAILPELTSLSAKLELITEVGYREGAGHKLVSETAATEFEGRWRSDVRSASSADLERESSLLRVLVVAKQDAAADEPPLQIPEAPKLTLAILRAARNEVRSQSSGSRAIRRSSRLAWEALIGLFGGHDELRERIARLKETKPEGEDELLSLADKYLGGWRPQDFGEE
jgi:predicted KAP-like P-loop ATPase